MCTLVLYLSTVRTLQCVLCNKASVCWGLTHDLAFCKYSDLISYIHKQRHMAHTGAYRLTHAYKYTLILPVTCSLYYIEWIICSVLHWMNNLVISKSYFVEFHYVSAFQKLLTWYICLDSIIWLDSISFSCETKNTEGYGVNKQNTHHHLLWES